MRQSPNETSGKIFNLRIFFICVSQFADFNGRSVGGHVCQPVNRFSLTKMDWRKKCFSQAFSGRWGNWKCWPLKFWIYFNFSFRYTCYWLVFWTLNMFVEHHLNFDLMTTYFQAKYLEIKVNWTIILSAI